MGWDFEDAFPPTVLDGELVASGVVNSSLGLENVFGVWKMNSKLGLPSALLPSELLNVL